MLFRSNDTATTEIYTRTYTLSLHDALPISAAIALQPAVDDIVLVDPVCGMTVDRAHARHLAEHEGVVYAFCRMGCRTAFIQEPGAYVPGPTPAGASSGSTSGEPPAPSR